MKNPYTNPAMNNVDHEINFYCPFSFKMMEEIEAGLKKAWAGPKACPVCFKINYSGFSYILVIR